MNCDKRIIAPGVQSLAGMLSTRRESPHQPLSKQLHKIVAIAAVAAIAIAVVGAAEATPLTSIPHNYLYVAEYHVDSKTFKITSAETNSKYRLVFASVDSVDLYDRSNHDKRVTVSNFTVSGVSVSATLSQTQHDKIAGSTDLGVSLKMDWAMLAWGAVAPTGDNSVALTGAASNSPKVVGATLDVENKNVVVTFDIPIKKANAGHICVVTVIPGVSLSNVCSSSYTLSPSGYVVTTALNTLPAPGNVTHIEVWPQAAQNSYNLWNTYYKKTL